MGQPKKRTSHRRTGTRRSHLAKKLARRVNATSPVKVGAKAKNKTKEVEQKPVAPSS